MNNLNDRGWSIISHQIWGVIDQINDQLVNQTDIEVRFQIGNQLWDQVNDQLVNQMRTVLYEQFK